MRRAATIAVVVAALAGQGAAHSGPDTPGIGIHHLPFWGWAVIAAVLIGIIYIMYAKTHNKPLNPVAWR